MNKNAYHAFKACQARKLLHNMLYYMHGIKNFQLNLLSKVTAKGLHLKSRVSHQVAVVDEKSLGYDLT